MKKNLLLTSAIIHLTSYIICAQTPNYLWAKSAGGTGPDFGISCATDAGGNIIATGGFGSSSITLGTTTLTNASSVGTYNMFIVKYDPSGNVLWAKSAGGTGHTWGYSCTTDGGGNIILTGGFGSSSITLGTTTLTNASPGFSDMFIVKYDPSGNVLWAKSTGGTGYEWGYSCTADPGGNIIVTGDFSSSSITLGTTTLTNASPGFSDMFIVKYDPSGNVLWAKSAGGTYNEKGYSCTTDAGGNIVATGIFNSLSITLGTTTLTNAAAGNDDMFIVKYDPSGNVLWAKGTGGTDFEGGYNCATDAGGNIIATGYFSSSSITIGTTTLSNASSGFTDLFIVKYDPSGNVLWAKGAGGMGGDVGRSCITDAGGNIIATGNFSSSSIALGTTTLTNASSGSDDILIVKYDPSGNILWAKGAGGIGADLVRSCTIDAGGNIIATGDFESSSITFGTTTMTNASAGNADILIVKLDGLTGIEEYNFETGVSVFPNPGSGIFNLSINQFENVKMKELKVYTILGECIHSQMDLSSNGQIDLSTAPNGIYFIKLNYDKGTATKKLIINH